MHKCDLKRLLYDYLQHALKYQQYFLQNVVQLVSDNQGEVRQAASYGIGVMAQYGGQGFTQTLTGQ